MFAHDWQAIGNIVIFPNPGHLRAGAETAEHQMDARWIPDECVTSLRQDVPQPKRSRATDGAVMAPFA
jgi:hypothetical protein